MPVARRFDHDECRALYATGQWTKVALAEKFGVSDRRIGQVVDPAIGRRDATRAAEWQKAGRCPDCGAQTTHRSSGDLRCVPCGAIARSTTARPDALQCVVCREWKPDADFPSNASEKHARRGRHGVCRSCQAAVRRDHRHRNREADNAYQREYRRRKRAAA